MHIGAEGWPWPGRVEAASWGQFSERHPTGKHANSTSVKSLPRREAYCDFALRKGAGQRGAPLALEECVPSAVHTTGVSLHRSTTWLRKRVTAISRSGCRRPRRMVFDRIRDELGRAVPPWVATEPARHTWRRTPAGSPAVGSDGTGSEQADAWPYAGRPQVDRHATSRRRTEAGHEQVDAGLRAGRPQELLRTPGAWGLIGGLSPQLIF